MSPKVLIGSVRIAEKAIEGRMEIATEISVSLLQGLKRAVPAVAKRVGGQAAFVEVSHMQDRSLVPRQADAMWRPAIAEDRSS